MFSTFKSIGKYLILSALLVFASLLAWILGGPFWGGLLLGSGSMWLFCSWLFFSDDGEG